MTNLFAEPVEAPVTFEAALTELQQIATRLEDGGEGLEASLKEFERGVRLLRVCYQLLESAEQKTVRCQRNRGPTRRQTPRRTSFRGS
ncbi:MAG: exodeoxyribonuclease VII small subunit [Planctomycetales bacterium 12-60-4]|nr:MAG: exodeoxyribonuclease VII small subunit [Planctomycetales bacterium 12-60-4]